MTVSDPTFTLLLTLRQALASDRAEAVAGAAAELHLNPPVTIDAALAALDLAAEYAAHPVATAALVRAALDYFRQFQTPSNEAPIRAHMLAYRQWLEMEGEYLGKELFPEMGADAGRLIPMNTGVDRLHHPHGFRQGLMPPPSSRAAKILSAAGIDLVEIRRRYDEDRAEQLQSESSLAEAAR